MIQALATKSPPPVTFLAAGLVTKVPVKTPEVVARPLRESPPVSGRECLPIASADRARCYVAATAGVVAGEAGLRNLIVSYGFLGEHARVRSLGAQYLESFPDSYYASRVRQLAFSSGR